MMKRLRILSVVLCLLLFPTAVCGTGLEGVYDQVCPVNTKVHLEETQMAVSMFNATGHAISRVEFSLYLFTGDGEPARYNGTHYFYAYAPDMHLHPLTEQTLYWTVEKHAGAEEIRDFQVVKVIFESGETWTKPEAPLFSQAFLYATNQKNDNDRYLLNENRELTLVDYSYSSESRLWYIWNDGPGWVPFSRDIVASCQVWAPEVRIRLEINGDPALSVTAEYAVTPSPGVVAMHFYATGETVQTKPSEISYLRTVGTPATAANVHTVDSGLPIGDVPLCVGLWDYTEAEERTWYIWDGKEEWLPFSFDRAPICEIWRTGTVYLKLAYPDSEAVYALSVKGV